jgi:hypothetical protein
LHSRSGQQSSSAIWYSLFVSPVLVSLLLILVGGILGSSPKTRFILFGIGLVLFAFYLPRNAIVVRTRSERVNTYDPDAYVARIKHSSLGVLLALQLAPIFVVWAVLISLFAVFH